MVDHPGHSEESHNRSHMSHPEFLEQAYVCWFPEIGMASKTEEQNTGRKSLQRRLRAQRMRYNGTLASRYFFPVRWQ